MSMHTISECSGLPVNISEKQRIISSLAGAVLIALGILDFNKSSLRKAIRLTAGSLLLMRGLSGYCPATAMKESRIRKKSDQLDEALEKEKMEEADPDV